MSNFLNQRVAQGSPSVAMEKGTYRIRRGPLLRNPENITFPYNKHNQHPQDTSLGPTPRSESQAISASLISQERRLVLLIMFLVFATFCCFTTAYYLLTTSRWASVSSRIGIAPGLVADQRRIAPHPQDDTPNSTPMSNTHLFRSSLVIPSPSSQSGLIQIHSPSPPVRLDEKFLSYLPHSGFHNQRIALENALVLARLLNRTLLVPPIRFGHRAIPHRNFTVLQQALDANYTAYLCQLSENATNRNDTIFLDFSAISERCAPKSKRKPLAYAYLPWGWITDFDSIRQLQPTIQTFGSTHFWLSFSRLHPHANDVLIIPDTSKYQYHFTDEIVLDPTSDLMTFTNATYSEDITLSSLADHPAKLIQLGSLFGSRRLKLSDPIHKAIRKQIRRHMNLRHPLLHNLSVDITAKISGPGSGSGFLGAHLRCNDGYFLETAIEHSRMLWWKLVYGILGLSIERTRQLELDLLITRNSSWSLPLRRFIKPSNSPVHLPFDSRSLALDVDLTKKCKGKLHTDPDLERLNVPLFIATDSKDPHTDEHLSLFRQTFPCIFFLGDFPQELERIGSIRDPISGMEIGNMLVPFLDAMVVSRATRVVGTPHSTFSWYVQDVLWRVNHGLDIVERNSD